MSSNHSSESSQANLFEAKPRQETNPTNNEEDDDEDDHQCAAKKALLQSETETARTDDAKSSSSLSCSPHTKHRQQATTKCNYSILMADKDYLAKRKLSQSSSQVSTSIISTSLAESSRRSSSIDQLIGMVRSNNNSRQHQQAGQHAQIEMSPVLKSHNNKQRLRIVNQNGNHHKSKQQAGGRRKTRLRKASLGSQGGSLARTSISRSMLELDGHQESRFFRVFWSSLSFEYEPSYLNKLFRRRPQVEEDNAAGQLQQQQPGRQKLVLNSLCGSFESNQLIAIIGPSGCGKTTFLQFLAGNNSHSSDKLRICGLSEPKVAFIGQDDCLLPGLTAKETLMYASRLQNQSRSTRGGQAESQRGFDHEQHIQPILSELGLLECSNRNVTKLSGGQAKRVTIAQELLYPTNLLILDEVTSGLDASTSYSIVKLLKYLVSDRTYPMSIVMSIHQPSARLFSVFDRVYLMSEGSCLYEGSCQIDTINRYLGRFQLECPRFHNIADYLIEVASDESLAAVRSQMIGYQRKRHQLSGHNEAAAAAATEKPSDKMSSYIQFDDPEHQREQDTTTNTATTTSSSLVNLDDDEQDELHDHDELEDGEQNFSLYEAIKRARLARERPFWPQFCIHLQRSLLRIRRSYILTYLQLITYIMLGLQLATFYGPNIGLLSGCPRIPGNMMALVLAASSSSTSGDLEDAAVDEIDEQAQEMRRIQENMNFLLVVVMTATFAALEITVITFPLEAKTIKREWRNGWYQVSSYFMGRTLADLPFQLVFVVLFCLIVYILTGQVGLYSWRFGSFVLVLVMTAFIAQSFGFAFGALFMDNLPAAVFTAPLCIFPTLLFSGFFARISQIPAIYRPLTYLSHFRYAFDALLVTLYGYERCDCDQAELARYHANLVNQTQSMREMFRYLFGSNECGGAPNELRSAVAGQAAALVAPQPENADAAAAAAESIINGQDLMAIQQANKTVAEMLLQVTGKQLAAAAAATDKQATNLAAAATTASSSLAVGQHLSEQLRTFEDALVDRVFNQMLSNSTSTTLAFDPANNMTATTPMPLGEQAGSEQPDSFANGITDHLAQEFSSKVTTMLIGLLTLLLIVVLTRLVCGLILNFTISTRAK